MPAKPGDALTLGIIRKMAEHLKAKNAHDIVAYIHPDLEADVRAFPDFIEMYDVVEFGRCGDLRFVRMKK